MTKPNNPDTDVVVIGAGIGGLSAARKLLKHGLTITVLEARDRVGGRLLSDSEFDLDLGATWFWPSEPRITQLVSDLGLDTFPQHTSGDALYEVPAGMERMKGNPIDVYSSRFSYGAQSLAIAMAKEISTTLIKLNEPVVSINSSENEIEAITSKYKYTARHIVLAVPPALAVSAIKFNPPLSDRLSELAHVTPVWMGAITKVVAIYSEPFWRREGLAGSAISYVGPMREVHDMSGPGGKPGALFGFVPPKTVNEPTVTEQSILVQLVNLFGDKASDYENLIIRDWRKESYTSPPNVETLNNYQVFGHAGYSAPALNSRLHWASTETSQENPGHIEGAIAAGDRAANAILSSIKS